jgi:hypothetical protein
VTFRGLFVSTTWVCGGRLWWYNAPKMATKQDMKKDSLLVVGGLILAILLYTFSIAFLSDEATPVEELLTIPPAGPIEVRGTMTCLPHWDTEGPQTLPCALGFQGEEGLYYALRDADPTYNTVSSVPMGVPVMVEGMFVPGKDAKYQSVGVIEVSQITQENTLRRIRISGTYSCLPRREEFSAEDTCLLGIQTYEGAYYAVDFSLLSQMPPEPKEGERIEAEGVYVPKGELSSNVWHQYDIEGVFSYEHGQ